MSKVLVIDNGGGIGNRMQSMLSGFYFRDKYNFTKTYLTWRYQWTWMAYYKDLLAPSPEYELIDESDLGYPPCIWQTGAIYPPELKEEDYKIMIPRDQQFKEEDMISAQAVILRKSGVYSKISNEETYRIIRNYFPKPSTKLSNNINLFLDSHGLETDKYLGVHMRRTDKIGFGPSDDYYISEIKRYLDNEGSKVFLCSDDPKSENKLKKMFPNNVFVRKKPENSEAVPFVGQFKNFDPNRNKVPFSKEIDDKLEQMIPRTGSNPPGWWIKERDINSGRMMYNIYRSRLHVIEAVTDFFILSRSSRILNSLGTFYDMANCISKSRKL